jgi:hypothetical protein
MWSVECEVWNVKCGVCHPERSNVVAESIYETSQLVDLVELGSKEQDLVEK